MVAQGRASPDGAVVPVPLHLVRPAALTVGQAFRRAVAVVDRSALAGPVEDALESRTGRRRELPGRALLIGLAWHAVLTVADLHLTDVAALLGRANNEQARELGVHRRELPAGRGHPSASSSRPPWSGWSCHTTRNPPIGDPARWCPVPAGLAAAGSRS